MRICIIGAGAIGGWLGVRLAASGQRVSVFARGATLERLRGGEWLLDTANGRLAASVEAASDAAELGQQDVIILALKGPALPEVAPLITPLISSETVILPLMNGVPWWFLLGGGGELAPATLQTVDKENTIATALPYDQVIGGVVHASVSITKPAHVELNAGNRLIIGEPDGSHSSRLAEVANLLSNAGFGVEVSDRIRYDIWYKLWGNMTMNPISALTGATCDLILDDPLISDFAIRIMSEAQAIGKRIGCDITERGEDRNQVTRKLGALKTSMLHDVEGGRALELDQLLSAPREIAQMLSLATPNLDALMGLVRLFGKMRGLYSRT